MSLSNRKQLWNIIRQFIKYIQNKIKCTKMLNQTYFFDQVKYTS